jgi:hypothetical protein
VTSNDAVVASDRDLFSPCATAVAAANCAGEADETARASCVDSRRAAYSRLHSPKMRRSWLIANGCPEATVDAPAQVTTAVVVAAPPPPPPAPPPTPPEPPIAVAPPAPSAAPAPPPAPPPTPPAPTATVVAGRHAPPKEQPAPAEPSPTHAQPPRPAPSPAIAAAPAPASVPPPPADAGLPNGAFSDRDRTEARTQRLRDIISSHRPEMKSCVDRQLKLAPELKAEGTLVINVEKNGSVPSADLLGADLAGTPLEACLRAAAARWRFPASAHPYTISAPVKVWGSGLAR